MLLSIIVPVYNVSPYLKKCLESLQCQALAPSDYEIIVINDGSTDDSLEISQTFLEQNTYPLSASIHLISQPNGGLSAARNTGILQAKGKYIQFVDSDDFLEPNVLGALVAKMEAEQLDILRFNYQNVNEQYQVFEPNKTTKPFVDYRDEMCDGLKFLAERLGYACYAVQFMIRATLLQKSESYFKPGIYFEDTEWTPRLLVKAKRVTSVDTIVYNYLIRTGSITRSVGVEKKHKVLTDLLISINSAHDLSAIYPQLVDWSLSFIARIHINYLKYLAHNLFQERRMFIAKLSSLNCLPIHSKCENKNYIFLINLSPALFVNLIKLKSLIK